MIISEQMCFLWYDGIGTACLMGGCLPSTILTSFGRVWERRAVDLTAYETVSLVIALIGLLIGVVTLLLKLFAFLDNRYKRK